MQTINIGEVALLRFANPDFFHLYWLLPVLIAFFVWTFRHKQKLLQRLGDEELIARLMAGVSRTKQIWKVVLVVLI
ncbi:MAG: hypothetical protein GWN16_09455, partial [Calditrichae bacterium]|nr:hypothetical protein [Calditrichia bacterium]